MAAKKTSPQKAVPATVSVPATNRIKTLRERSRLTQQEMSVLTGIDYTTISKHENASRGIDEEALARYARVFKVQSHELFIDSGDSDTYDGREWKQYNPGSPTKG